MKIKYSALVSDMRGKLNGSVASKNRYGSYLRNKVTPINRNTTFQVAVRAILTLISQAWRSLTEAQRKQWSDAVQNFKGTNIFGDAKILSGSALYAKLNGNLLTIGESQIAVPPMPVAVPTPNLTAATCDNSSQSVVVEFDAAIGATETCILEATPPMSAGKSFVKSEFRIIDLLAAADTSPVTATSAYIAKFGNVGAVGQKIHFRLTAVSKATGIKGSTSEVSTVVVS